MIIDVVVHQVVDLQFPASDYLIDELDLQSPPFADGELAASATIESSPVFTHDWAVNSG